MSLYLDTSVLAGLFIEADVFAVRAARFFAETDDTLIVSDFVAAEFASVVARVTRTKTISETEARAIFAGFDAWRSRFAREADVTSADIQAAETIIRRLDLNLRAPDAINVAIAQRIGATIATFDRGMMQNAGILGIAVAAA